MASTVLSGRSHSALCFSQAADTIRFQTNLYWRFKLHRYALFSNDNVLKNLNLCSMQEKQQYSKGKNLLSKNSLKPTPKPTDKLMAVAASISTPCVQEVASTLFTLGTAFVVPFYTVMILAPNAKSTRKVVQSSLPYIVLGVIYLYLLVLSWSPETLKLMFASKYWLPELPGITKMFSSTVTVASAWIHLLAVDLYAGRQIYLEGLQHSFETRHSLILCLLFCPVGILSHYVTKIVVQTWRRGNKKDAPDVAELYT